MKKFLKLFTATFLSILLCCSLLSCSVLQSKKENDYSWGDLLIDSFRTYDITEWEEFIADYEEFVDSYAIAKSGEISLVDSLKYLLGLKHYLQQSQSIANEFISLSKNGSTDHHYEMTEYSYALSAITDKLSQVQSDNNSYNDDYDEFRSYDVTEWRELLSAYEENWKAYWIASDKYDADPSDTAALEERDKFSKRLGKIADQLLDIQYELAEKAESGLKEDVEEYQEFLDEIERINNDVVYH